MKTKKSIRKLSPLARKAAHISRDIHSMQRQVDSLTEAIGKIEFENKALQEALDAVMGEYRAAKVAALQQPISEEADRPGTGGATANRLADLPPSEQAYLFEGLQP